MIIQMNNHHWNINRKRYVFANAFVHDILPVAAVLTDKYHQVYLMQHGVIF